MIRIISKRGEIVEEEIIQLMQMQDFAGLELFIDEYSDSIYKTIYSILAYPNERPYFDDVMNEVLYEIWKKIHLYDSSKSSLQTWVLMITRNLSIDWKRILLKEQKSLGVDFPDISIKKDAQKKENFLSEIDQLTEQDQFIFLYYYFYQFSANEIAQLLSIKEEAVFNRHSRGRKKLREWEEQNHGKF
jgi:RNA polymerase sigma-70 factor (ECF subfamily)